MSDIILTSSLDTSAWNKQAADAARRLPTVRFNVDTKPLGVISGQISEFQRSLQAASARTLAFSATAGQIYGISRAFQAVFKSMIDVEKQLTDINVVLGLSKSQLNGFSNALFQVANKTGQSFKVAADAALELSRQGLSVQETLKRTADALTLTRLSGLDATKSVQAITAAINGFNDVALDSTAIVNKLATVDAAFAVSSKDLAEAFSRVGSTARDTKVSFDELIGLVTAAKQVTGRDGAVIGNALKTIFTRIERTDTLNQLKQLGILVEDVSGEALGAKQILTNLAQAYDTLSSSQKNQVVQLSAGVFQANQFRAILQDLSRQSSITARATDVSANATDQAARRQQELNKTLASSINETVNNLTNAASKIGKLTLEPALKVVLDGKGIAPGLNKMASFVSGQGEEQGQTIGSFIGTGILKGLGNYLSGPGLALGGALILRLFASFASFAAKSLAQVIEVTSTRYQTEQAITKLLSEQPSLYGRINSLGGDQQKIQALINQELLRGNVLMNERAAAVARLTSITGASSLRAGISNLPFQVVNEQVATNPRFRRPGAAVGLIPAAREIAGAYAGGYPPGQVKELTDPELGRIIYNSAEKVKTFPGFSQPAIIPPQSSKAGINYNKAFQSAHGFSPYANKGIIPNYAGYKINPGVSGGLNAELMVGKTKVRAMINNEGTIGFSGDGSIFGKTGAGAFKTMNALKEPLLEMMQTMTKSNPLQTFQFDAGSFQNIKSPRQKLYERYLKKAGIRLGEYNNFSLPEDLRANLGLIPNFMPQISKSEAAKLIMRLRQNISSITYDSASLGRPVNVNALQWSSAVRHDLKTGTRPGNVKRQLENEYLTLRGSFDGGETQIKNIAWDKIKQIRAQGETYDVMNRGLVPNYANNPFGVPENFPKHLQQSKLKKKLELFQYNMPGLGLEFPEFNLTKMVGGYNQLKGWKNIDEQGFFNKGLVPNFNALTSAILREKSAGLPMSQIRVGHSPTLASGLNPLGLGVYNTRDEPGGLNQGIRRVASMGLDPKKAGVPNFAANLQFQNFTPAETRQAVISEYEKQAQYVKLGSKSAAEALKSFQQLAGTSKLLVDSIASVSRSFTGLQRTYQKPGGGVTRNQLTGGLFDDQLTFGSFQKSNYGAQGEFVGVAQQTEVQIRNKAARDAARALNANIQTREQGHIAREQESQLFANKSAAWRKEQAEIQRRQALVFASPTLTQGSLAANIAAREQMHQLFDVEGARQSAEEHKRNAEKTRLLNNSRQNTLSLLPTIRNGFFGTGLNTSPSGTGRGVGYGLGNILNTAPEYQRLRSQQVNTFNQTLGGLGLRSVLFNTRDYRDATAQARGVGGEGSLRDFRNNVANRALTASFVTPLLAGLAQQGAETVFGNESPEARTASKAVGGAGNIASFALTGLGIAGGHPLGAAAGVAIGILTELPAVFKSFSDTLPDLQRNLEKLKETAGQSSVSISSYIDVSERLFDKENLKGLTRGQVKQLRGQQLEAGTSIPFSEDRRRFRELVQAGNFGGARELQGNLEQYFAQQLRGNEQEQRTQKFLETFSNTQVTEAKIRGTFSSGEQGPVDESFLKGAIQEALDKPQRKQDIELYTSSAVSQAFGLINKEGTSLFDIASKSENIRKFGEGKNPIDVLSQLGTDNKINPIALLSNVEALRQLFDKGGKEFQDAIKKAFSVEEIQKTVDNAKKFEESSKDYTKSLDSFNKKLIELSSSGRDAVNKFEIGVLQRFSRAVTKIDVGQIGLKSANQISLANAGDNQYLKNFLDLQEKQNGAQNDFSKQVLGAQGNLSSGVANLLSRGLTDFLSKARETIPDRLKGTTNKDLNATIALRENIFKETFKGFANVDGSTFSLGNKKDFNAEDIKTIRASINSQVERLDKEGAVDPLINNIESVLKKLENTPGAKTLRGLSGPNSDFTELLNATNGVQDEKTRNFLLDSDIETLRSRKISSDIRKVVQDNLRASDEMLQELSNTLDKQIAQFTEDLSSTNEKAAAEFKGNKQLFGTQFAIEQSGLRFRSGIDVNSVIGRGRLERESSVSDPSRQLNIRQSIANREIADQFRKSVQGAFPGIQLNNINQLGGQIDSRRARLGSLSEFLSNGGQDSGEAARELNQIQGEIEKLTGLQNEFTDAIKKSNAEFENLRIISRLENIQFNKDLNLTNPGGISEFRKNRKLFGGEFGKTQSLLGFKSGVNINSITNTGELERQSLISNPREQLAIQQAIERNKIGDEFRTSISDAYKGIQLNNISELGGVISSKQNEAESLKNSGNEKDKDRLIDLQGQIKKLTEFQNGYTRAIEESNAKTRDLNKNLELQLAFSENIAAALRNQNINKAADRQSFNNKDLKEAFGSELQYSAQSLNRDLITGAQDFGKEFKEAFKGGFREAITGTKNFGDAMRGIGLNIAASISGKVSDIAINSILGSVFNNTGNQSSLVAGLSGLFGGGKANGGYIPRYARGGFVNMGSGVRDDVPAFLSGGEFVLNKRAVSRIGKQNLDAINFNKGVNQPDQFIRYADASKNDESQFSGAVKSDSSSLSGNSAIIKLANTLEVDRKGYALKNGSFNVSPLLSNFALTDENNPQNKLRFARESYGLERKKYEAEVKKALDEWQANRESALFTSLALAGVSAVAQYGAGRLNNSLTATGNTAPNYNPGQIKTPFTSAQLIKTGGYARGGYFGGDSLNDRPSAMVMGGEYIMSPKTVSNYGVNYFKGLNGYAGGGYVGGSSSNTDLSDNIAKLISINEEIRDRLNPTSNAKDNQSKKEDKSGGNVFNINITTTMASNGSVQNTKTDVTGGANKSEEDREMLVRISKTIEGKVREVIAVESKPGGQLSEKFVSRR